MSSRLKPVLTAGALLYLACAAEMAGQDILRLNQECGQGRDKSCQELAKIATSAKDSAIRFSAIRGVIDQNTLARIATTDVSAAARRAAVIRLTDQNTLRTVATNDRDPDVRSEAARKLQDSAVAAQIAKTDTNAMVRMAAIDRIQDPTVLQDISSSDADPAIQRAARKRISDLGAKPPTAAGSRSATADDPKPIMSVDDVLKVKRTGAASDLIIGQIRKSAPGYDISKDDLVRLFDGGVPVDVIRAMVQRSEEPREKPVPPNPGGQPVSDSGPWPLDLGENPKVVYLPAISYGPNQWSVVKITNPSTDRIPVRFEAFRADGSTHPASADFVSEPQGEQEIRVEGAQVGYEEPWTYAWVRVTYPEQAEGITITTSMDRIDEKDKNILHSVPRKPSELTEPPQTVWAYKTDGLQGKSLYFLNVGDEEATVRLCQGNNTGGRCPPSSALLHLASKASQSEARLQGFTSPFLMIQTEQQSKLVVMLLTPSDGELKQYTSKSTITFGGSDQ